MILESLRSISFNMGSVLLVMKSVYSVYRYTKYQLLQRNHFRLDHITDDLRESNFHANLNSLRNKTLYGHLLNIE